MKILMVSIFAPHFFNWTEQLRDSGHEVFWLDVFDSNTRVNQIDFVDQIIGWRYKWNYPGRHLLKQKAREATRLINIINERNLLKIFEEKLNEIKPDVVHSFVMHLSCFPIYSIMKKKTEIKWIYSSWGSDMYFYQQNENDLNEIKKILPRIDYMFSDCYRDFSIAENHGFTGEFLGVFPGGGGFDFQKTDAFITPLHSRCTILIKGYEGKHGRAINVLKALEGIKAELASYNLTIFGATREVLDYIKNSDLKSWSNLDVLLRISHPEVIKLMGKSKIYIGNSRSDGMPNTLLEAIIMGAYPIQSNPGGATAELIIDGRNGRLIQDPENINEIKNKILTSLKSNFEIEGGVKYNFNEVKPLLERNTIKEQVLKKYQHIQERL